MISAKIILYPCDRGVKDVTYISNPFQRWRQGHHGELRREGLK